MPPLRIGIVGAGGIARQRHIPNFKTLAEVELAGVANRSRESSERAAREHGFRKAYDRWQDLVADPEIDAVVCSAWPYLHEPVTVAALEAGKHILCQGRMARDAGEAKRMLAAHQARPNLVAQVVPYPNTLGVDATVKQLLSSGAIGDVLEVDVIATTAQSLDAAAPLHWRQRSDYSGVNMLFIGAHYETLLRYIPPVERVLADGAVYVPSRVDPDTGQPAEVAIPDAITVLASRGPRHRQVYHLSAAHSGPPTTVYELHGSQGALRIAGGRLYRAGARDREWTQVEIAPGMAADWEVEAQFVASIRDGQPVTLTSFEDGARYMEFTEAAWRSWQEGRAMSLPLQD